jgi:spore maturation protein CgeB
MARFGASPPTRIFEAAGAGAAILSDRWAGIEAFLEPGTEILLASDGAEVAAHVEALSDEAARAMGEGGAPAHSRPPHLRAPCRGGGGADGRPRRLAKGELMARIVFLGLSITSSWGNGHATTFRSLLKALSRRGHTLTFLERDVPWYADHRDLPAPPYCRTVLYRDLADLERHASLLREADAVVVGSYVPEGVAVGHWAIANATSSVAFYDIDTPVTLAKLAAGDEEYLSASLLVAYDVYLSFTGGPTLRRIEAMGSPRAAALYCSVDPEVHVPVAVPRRWRLGYLGTYSADRQPTLESLLAAPARALADVSFVVAGPQYPDDITWPDNVERIAHLPPADHAAWYSAQDFTLNVTRADMRRAGWSPSVRLFEAAACGVPIISDAWPGLDEILKPGEEILVAETACRRRSASSPAPRRSSATPLPPPRAAPSSRATRRTIARPSWKRCSSRPAAPVRLGRPDCADAACRASDPGPLGRRLRLVRGDRRGALHGEADLVEAMHQAVLQPWVDVEADRLAVVARHRLVGKIHRQRRVGAALGMGHQPGELVRRHRDRQEAVLEAVLVKNVGERRRDHAPDAPVEERPRRMLARGAAAEIVACDENLRAGIGRLIERKVGVGRAVRPPRDLGEEPFAEAGALDRLQVVLRDDHVGVDVDHREGRCDGGQCRERLHGPSLRTGQRVLRSSASSALMFSSSR